jgi:hypothetical protein
MMEVSMKARRPGPLDRIACLGLVFLAVANVVTFVLTRHTSLSEDVVDPLAGLLQGVAIATLLLSLYRQARTTGSDTWCA